MKKIFIIPLLLSLAALLLQGCSPDTGSGQKNRTLKLPYPETSIDQTGTISDPTLALEQEVQNCTDSEKCHLEGTSEPFVSDGKTYRINSIIYSDTDIMSGSNVQDAPIINFRLKGLDISTITASTMRYNKKDGIGNILIQTAEVGISDNDGLYSVPIHSSLLGSGILISAPYEKHTISMKVQTNNAHSYEFHIEFFISSNTVNPVIMERDTQIMNAHYYKMDQDLQSYLIDSVSLENTLPVAVTLNGNININNSTIAILEQRHHAQHKTFIAETAGYPFDTYNWYTQTVSSYGSATAVPTYTIKIESNGIEEELAVTSSYNGLESIISYSGLVINGGQKVKLNTYANMTTNNSVLGDHGQENFFEGRSLCSTLDINASCKCFFAPLNINNSSLTGALFYNAATTIMLSIQNMYYPNCGSGVPSGTVTQQLFIASHPAASISLIGRLHRSDLKYTVTTWINGYEDQNDLGTTSMTMDTLEAVKGSSDLSLTDPGLSYQGYIPGTL